MPQRPVEAVQSWTARRVVLATLTVLAIVGAGWLLYRFRTVWVTLLVAIVLGSSIKAPVEWLTRRGPPKAVAALAVCTIILALAVGFVLVVCPMAVEQLPLVSSKLGALYQSARGHMLASSSRIVLRLAGHLPPTAPEVTLAAPATVASGLDTLGSLLRGLFLLMVVPVVAVLWTVDGARAVATLVRAAPVEMRAALRELVAGAEEKMGAFVRAQAIVCLSVGLTLYPAYLVIGVPHALVLALVAAVLEVLSYPGTIAAGGLAALMALTQSPLKALWVIVAVVGINLLQGYLVAPRVMRGVVGVSAFVRLLAITAFGFVAGIAGVFLAVPAAAVGHLLFERLAHGRKAAVSPP
jgi:predicted PurR-regulated permease PerM